MSSLALFDLAIGVGGPSLPAGGEAADRTGRLAERLVDAALGELRYLQELDAALAPGPGRAFDRRAAVLLRAMYEEWGRAADAALQRIRRVELSTGRAVADCPRLRDAHGRVMAMLSVTLEDIDEARDQIRRGETYSIEEVRRELRTAADR